MSSTFAKWYDFFMGPLERHKFMKIRMELLQNAKGKVLEIGSGTGVNFPLYRMAESVTAIEPGQSMIMQSRKKQSQAAVPLEIVKAGAEHLPFADESFDSVVATLVFCTIPEVDRALAEIKRVCKPGGTILLFEHVKMDHPFLAKLQDWLTPTWKRICDGCCLNRDTYHHFLESGFEVIETKKYYKGLFIAVEMRK